MVATYIKMIMHNMQVSQIDNEYIPLLFTLHVFKGDIGRVFGFDKKNFLVLTLALWQAFFRGGLSNF